MKVARAIVSNGIVVSFIETDPFWSESEFRKEHYFGWLKVWLKKFLWMFDLGIGLVFFYGVLVHLASNSNLQQPHFTDSHLQWKSRK